jgi:hypothetical protein
VGQLPGGASNATAFIVAAVFPLLFLRLRTPVAAHCSASAAARTVGSNSGGPLSRSARAVVERRGPPGSGCGQCAMKGRQGSRRQGTRQGHVAPVGEAHEGRRAARDATTVKGKPMRAAGERPSLADDGSAWVSPRTCGNVVKARRTKTNLIVRSITSAFVK